MCVCVCVFTNYDSKLFRGLNVTLKAFNNYLINSMLILDEYSEGLDAVSLC